MWHSRKRFKKRNQMTSVDVYFRYGAPPTESVVRAIDSVREVYGIRQVVFNEQQRTLRVEYDASRLNQETVASLLRRAGVDIQENLSSV